MIRVHLTAERFFQTLERWFGNSQRLVLVLAVNITENKDELAVSLPEPGMKKDDLRIDIDGNMLTISSEKEECTDEKNKKFTRKEYNYSSFSRSFTLPDEADKR